MSPDEFWELVRLAALDANIDLRLHERPVLMFALGDVHARLAAQEADAGAFVVIRKAIKEYDRAFQPFTFDWLRGGPSF